MFDYQFENFKQNECYFYELCKRIKVIYFICIEVDIQVIC